MGAVGSAAPWFLTGWANDLEVEFMIDTGCQVTILATSVFERMCAADPQVRSRLRPCVRRLVSADSSPLTVIGELELDVVFPGLSCVMLFMVARFGWIIGHGGPTVMPTTSIGLTHQPTMGRRSGDVTAASTETHPRGARVVADRRGAPTG